MEIWSRMYLILTQRFMKACNVQKKPLSCFAFTAKKVLIRFVLPSIEGPS